MTRRSNLALCALVALLGVCAVTAQAQDVAASRSSVKVRPRFFNPFVSPELGRITVNPFGMITFSQPMALSLAATNVAAATAPAATGGALESTGVAAGSVRPPFDPGRRSNFRPLPSPPFP
jgi:hypothetical protein